jgi:hypothetical protein
LAHQIREIVEGQKARRGEGKNDEEGKQDEDENSFGKASSEKLHNPG